MTRISVKNNKGITLVELLISLLIVGILIMAGFNAYLTQHKSWIIEEYISDMQQNARSAMRELASRIRMAGYGVPDGINPIWGSNTDPDTITLLFRNEFGCESTIEWEMPLPSSELRCDGHDVSCFKESTWAYIYDPFAKEGEFFYISEVQTGSSHIQHNTMDLSKCYPAGSIVLMMDFYKYYIDNITYPNHPRLMVVKAGNTSPEVYAEDIEDLQFAYALANGAYVDTPPIGKVVREVRIALTARTEKKDLQFQNEYRRRTFSSNVKVRNLGLQ
jgi:prepilin-type N-terminal cleavage/methylation domain-containing protein